MSNFKKTIRTILLFVLIVVVFSVVIMAAYFGGENYYYQDRKERDEMSGTIDFLVLGSSHAMRAYKPDVLDEELNVTSYNLSIANSTMQGRYEMLEVELERNPIDTVVLDVSFNSLTKSDDYNGYEGDFYVLSKLNLTDGVPYFFESIKPSDYISIYYEFLHKGFSCLDKLVHGTWTSWNQTSDRGYIAYQNKHIARDDERYPVTDDYASIYNTRVFSEEPYAPGTEYFDKILDLCEEKGVKVILTSVPLSDTFISTYKNLDVFREWYEEIAEERGIQFFDFNLYKEKTEVLSDDEALYDIRHLNDKGAERFSEIFSDVYKKAENGEDVNNLFYDSYEEMKAQVFGFSS